MTRAEENAAAEPIRAAYRLEFPWCQNPGCRKPASDIHEITPGPRRRLAIGKRALLLSLCRPCHLNEVQKMPHAKQLKIKMQVDPEGYDLEAYREVMRGSCGRPAVVLTQADVDAA